MKQRIALFILIVIVLIPIGMTCYLAYDNDRLNNIILEQNTFIKDVTGRDSIFIGQSKKYRDSLEKYTDKLSYYIDGKKVDSRQFFNAYKKLEKQRDSILDLYDYAKKRYGFNIYRKELNDTTIQLGTQKFNRADSADMTYYFFKKRIKKDKKGYWTADVTSEKDLKDLEKRIDEVNKTAKQILDSAKRH